MALTILPTGNLTTSAGLAYLQDLHIQEEALDQLWEMFRFRAACDEHVLPLNSGLTYRVHRWDSMPAGTNSSVEGDQSTGLTISNRVGTATVSQFTSFVSVSDLLVATAPDNILAEAANQLGYRAGRTVDLMTRNVIDSQAHNTNQAPNGTSLSVVDLRAARTSLAQNNVRPFSNGEFLCYIAPLNTFDLVNDPNANGFADIFKRGNVKNTELVAYNENGTITSVAGCRIVETTNCYSFTSGTAKYRTYIFGKGGLGVVDLQSRAPSKVTDPKTQNFRINVVRSSGPDKLDPEGVIGGHVSYNFVTTTFFKSGPAPLGDVYRNRTIDTTPTISA